MRASHATITRLGRKVGLAPSGTSSIGLPEEKSAPSKTFSLSVSPRSASGPTKVMSA